MRGGGGIRMLRRSSPPDRRAARLVALAAPAYAPEPAAERPVSGVAALRAALAECAADPDSSAAVPVGLAAAARSLADVARADGAVHGEQLVISLKRVWHTLPEAQRLPIGGPREAVWSRLVALCMRAFYAPVPPAPSGALATSGFVSSLPLDRAVHS